jgi:hypothetical protein
MMIKIYAGVSNTSFERTALQALISVGSTPEAQHLHSR